LVVSVDSAWAVDGIQKWAFRTSGKVLSSPAVSADGTIYVGSMDELGGGNLYAVKPDGTQKWSFSMGGVKSSPAIGADGTIYVGSFQSLYAINPDGTQKWRLSSTPVSVSSSPAIGVDGTIYVGVDNAGLFATNQDATQKWWFPVNGSYASPAIADDGTVYFLGISQFYAINPDGTQKWAIDVTGQYACPAIGSDGTIYLWGEIDGKLHAIRPEDGSEKWSFTAEGFAMNSSAAVGPDGIIYAMGGSDGNLYAINPTDGSQRWAFKMGNGSQSSPAIGADGTIYVGSEDNNIYAIKPNGTRKWEFKTGGSVESSPAISPDGTIYVGSNDNNLYAINGSSGGLAHTGWPMFHRNLRHTGLNAKSPVADIKANGYDGYLRVSSSEIVFITVALDAGSFEGQNGDWWVVESTPSSSYNHLELGTGSMVPGLSPTLQGRLFNLGDTYLLNLSDLTVGSHTFYFGVDLSVNGLPDMDSMHYDSVNVYVQ